MAGQTLWNDDRPDITEKNFVVKAQIMRGLYYAAAMNTLFGKLNGPRELRTLQNIHKGGTITIPDGKESPVWQQQANENNTAKFTLREPNKGMATYGDAPVKTGQFAEYMHCEMNVRTVSSPAFPVVGFESQENIKRVINDVVAVEKDNIRRWASEEQDLDAFRSIFYGASRGLLLTADGGMGIATPGGTSGQARSPVNTLVAGQVDLTPTAWAVAAHNTNLANLLAALTDNDAFYFSYRTHELISYLIDKIGLAPVKIGGVQYRAVAITDEWNIFNLRDRTGPLSALWQNATPRSDKNLAIYSRSTLALDDILYIPTSQLRFFRPTVAGGVITYGAGMDSDPRLSSFSNPSNILPTVVMGAGALLRGTRRGEMKFTMEVGAHGKGAEYAIHYQDGWRRSDWFAQDGRQAMSNDSSFVVFNYGKSPMAAST
jgi:hypothetical protein